MNFKTIDDIENSVIQFVGLKLPRVYTEDEVKQFLDIIISDEIFTKTYSTFGIRREMDILLFQMHRDLEILSKRIKRIMSKSSIGMKSEIAMILTGIIRKSKYGSKVPLEDYAIVGNSNQGKYLVVYPFVKTSEWYLEDFKTRAEMMGEHIKVGRKYPEVKQLLAYSFGLDDQEFIVAYEMNDIVVFQDLVMELRETKARKYTLRDTPIISAISVDPDRLFEL